MKTKIDFCTYFKQIREKTHFSLIYRFAACLVLSWLYAASSQIIIPLPFNLVPISIQPIPVLLFSLIIGWPAVCAYILYLAQGACGAPIFAGMLGGMTRLMGPTGGYLIGFGVAACFLASVRNYKQGSLLATILKIICAHVIIFSCGLAQLSAFVPLNILLSAGLYPFIVGDFFIKTGIIAYCLQKLEILKQTLVRTTP